MNRFSKITAVIAFWSTLALFAAVLLITVFQKHCMSFYFQSPDMYAGIVIIPWQTLIHCVLTAVITGLYLLKARKSPRTAAILALYFYGGVTVIFKSPLTDIGTALYVARYYGAAFLAVHSAFHSLTALFSFFFLAVAVPSFILSAGSAIIQPESPVSETVKTAISAKKRSTVILFSAFLGYFGADRFYAGRPFLGTVKLLFGVLIAAGFMVQYLAFGTVFAFLLFSPAVKTADTACLAAAAVWNAVDFVLAASGKMKDGGRKCIAVW